jgi:hypothetical protein
VRKTPSADVEEGSLGATVDLKAPHPLDFKKSFVATVSAKGVWNEVSKKLDPRFSVLLSKQNEDGTSASSPPPATATAIFAKWAIRRSTFCRPM